MQLPGKSYGKAFNNLFVKYHRASDHPLKLRIIRVIESLVGTKRLVVNTKFNFKFSIDKNDLIQRSVLEELVWEEDLSKFYSSVLTDKDVFFDIGANVGYFSCLALSSKSKLVVSFEPDPRNAEIINFNFNINNFNPSNYNIINVALGEENGSAIFYRGNTANTGISGLIKNYDEYESQFEVKVQTLDSLIENGLTPPTVLKIDTEGYELNILKGAKTLLKNHPPRIIVFEANTNEEFTAIRTLLSEFGYQFYKELKDAHGLNYIATQHELK